MRLFSCKKSIILFAALLLTPLVYVLSIIWRVSVYEQEYFGWSCLIPMSLQSPKYREPPTADSYGSTTYSFFRDGKPIRVHKQLINGFQHTFGSALADLELGREPADLLFRANEYFEAVFLKNAGTEAFALDTRKDLANNAFGREIGELARRKGLSGHQAEQFIARVTLEAMDKGAVLNHYSNPRVRSLPSPEQYGCINLPTTKGWFNYF